MIQQLSRRCDRSHVHQHLEGGRPANAAFYPIELVEAILRGIRDTADAEGVREEPEHDDKVLCAMAAAAQNVGDDLDDGEHELEDLASAETDSKDSLPQQHGGKTEISYNDINVKAKYVDEYTEEELHRERVETCNGRRLARCW